MCACRGTCAVSGGQRQPSGVSSILVSCVEFSIMIAYVLPASFLTGCSGSESRREMESSIYLPLKPKSVSVLRKVMGFLLFYGLTDQQKKESAVKCVSLPHAG